MARTVLITGGARGIGRAIALRFAEHGDNIVLGYNSTPPGDVVKEVERLGAKCLPVRCDVTQFHSAEAMVKEAKEAFSSIDVLINNAGITRDGLLMRMSEDDFDAVLETNLKGAFNMVRHVSPIMLKARSGAIVNVSSVVGLVGNVGQLNYAASKAGLIGLTKSAAKELAMRGVTCNAVAPGFIETDMTAALAEGAAKAILGSIPLGRYGRPEEVAEAIFFLAGQSYITGQVLTIDGGMVM